MFDSIFGNGSSDETHPTEERQATLTPFQAEMQEIRDALNEGRVVDAFGKFENLNPCQLNNVADELNKDRSQHYGYLTSVSESDKLDHITFSVHRLGTNKVIPVLSADFPTCKKYQESISR